MRLKQISKRSICDSKIIDSECLIMVHNSGHQVRITEKLYYKTATGVEIYLNTIKAPVVMINNSRPVRLKGYSFNKVKLLQHQQFHAPY